MVYFILWVVIILAVILAIPVTSWMENRRRRALLGPPEPEESLDEVSPDEEAAEGIDEAVEEVEEEPIEVSGGGDFSAFDEEFK